MDKVNDTLAQFFESDGKISDGFTRKSVLLQMVRDLQFSLGIGRSGWIKLGLSDEQIKIKSDMLPLLAPVLLFNTAVDLLARVKLARLTRRGENGDVFQSLLVGYFGFTPQEAQVFWDFRNSLSHQYTMPKNVALFRAGSHDIIEQVVNRDDLWFIYVHPMYTTLDGAKNKIYEEIRASDQENKQNVANFIEQHGFIRQQLKKEVKMPA